jgi:hypothetical protein
MSLVKKFPTPLTAPQSPATTLEAKCDTRTACLFAPIPPAHLSYIRKIQYLTVKPLLHSSAHESIASALSNALLNKAPSPDGILMYLLKLLGRPAVIYL